MKRVLTALALIPFAFYAIFWAQHLGVRRHCGHDGCWLLSRIRHRSRTRMESRVRLGPAMSSACFICIDPSLQPVCSLSLVLMVALRLADFRKSVDFAGAVRCSAFFILSALAMRHRPARHQPVLDSLCAGDQLGWRHRRVLCRSLDRPPQTRAAHQPR